jgi:hypothetical protein
MSIEEYVQNSREEQRQLFGDIELKTDCKYYKYNEIAKEHTCYMLKDWTNGHSRPCLQCQKEVCYFYKPKV